MWILVNTTGDEFNIVLRGTLREVLAEAKQYGIPFPKDSGLKITDSLFIHNKEIADE